MLASDTKVKKFLNRKRILFISILIISTTVTFLPLPLNHAEKIALGIFIMSLLLWMTEAIPLYVTSILILFLSSTLLTPAIKVKDPSFTNAVFLAPFFSDIIALFLGGLLLAKAGSKYYIDTWLAKTLIRFSGKDPKYILLSMMIATATLSMWMSNTATTAMMLIITVAIVNTLSESSKIKKAFFIGIPFAANIGGMGTPVGTPPNAIAMAQINKVVETPITFIGWMIAAIPLVVILLYILWQVLVLAYPNNNNEEITYKADTELKKDFPTLTVMGVFFLTVVLWLTSELHGISSGMVALIPAIVFLGSQILETKDFKAISWDVLFLVAGGSTLAVVLQKSGLATDVLALIPFHQMETIIVLIIFVTIGSIMTTFMSNTATANIIIPLIILIPNIADMPIAVATALAISSSMVLPVSTPPNALAYSSGYIGFKDMLRIGLFISIVGLAAIIVLGYNWWKFLGYF